MIERPPLPEEYAQIMNALRMLMNSYRRDEMTTELQLAHLCYELIGFELTMKRSATRNSIHKKQRLLNVAKSKFIRAMRKDPALDFVASEAKRRAGIRAREISP